MQKRTGAAYLEFPEDLAEQKTDAALFNVDSAHRAGIYRAIGNPVWHN